MPLSKASPSSLASRASTAFLIEVAAAFFFVEDRNKSSELAMLCVRPVNPDDVGVSGGVGPGQSLRGSARQP
eukprot:SAG31_NODE_259_length_18917_cov_28.559677_22_plen_72_part_00